MHEEFEFGPIKIIKDDNGYGIAHMVEKEPAKWEVIANFKYLNDFIRFLSKHLEREIQKQESYNEALALNQSLLNLQVSGSNEDDCEDCNDEPI